MFILKLIVTLGIFVEIWTNEFIGQWQDKPDVMPFFGIKIFFCTNAISTVCLQYNVKLASSTILLYRLWTKVFALIMIFWLQFLNNLPAILSIQRSCDLVQHFSYELSNCWLTGTNVDNKKSRMLRHVSLKIDHFYLWMHYFIVSVYKFKNCMYLFQNRQKNCSVKQLFFVEISVRLITNSLFLLRIN